MENSYKYIGYIALIAIVLVVCFSYLFYIKSKLKYIGIVMLLSVMMFLGYQFHWMWYGIFAASIFTGWLFYSLIRPKNSKGPQDKEKKRERKITLKYTERNGRPANGQITFKNDAGYQFLTYAGANGGKTASVGKPLLVEFMRNQESIFCYDAKENDFTNTAFKIKEDIGYELPIYNINFADPSRGYRFNPIKASLIKDESYVQEYMTFFYVANSKAKQLGEWDDKALGLLKGVAYSMFKCYPEYFSFPHIINFAIHNSNKSIDAFLRLRPESIGFAKAFIDSADSEKTRSSIKSTLSGVIGGFAANKKMCYVLSGDDFDYNLVDPKNPKSVFVSNNFDLRNQISPVVVLLFIIAFRSVKFGNQVPLCGFLDEATTFRIPDFETYPSELREYLVSFVVLTQSAAKIIKTYDIETKSSIEANFPNQFIGRTQDQRALDDYVTRFSQKETFRKSVTIRTEGGGKSVTKSPTKEYKYDKTFFQNMKSGEFIGFAVDANVQEFHMRFKQYEGGKLSKPPLVKHTTNEDLETHYKQIIDDVTQKIYKKNDK